LWAFIQPLLTLIIFTFIFGYAIKVKTDNIPYPVFVLTGMIAWNYFSIVVSLASRSIINEQNMVKKIYFPRIIIPISKAGVGLIDFLITLLLLIGMMFYYGITPSINVIWLPLFIILIIISSLAIGIWISALTIRYRDFQHIVPFILQVGMYATPIAYSIIYIPEKYLWIYYIINPMVGVVEGCRWSIIGAGAPSVYIFYSILFIILLFITSLYYFKKVERVIADIV
jgi:lipopolysaccharide transport system permease protein